MERDITKVSPLVSSQLPEFVRVDHPALVSFLSAYYEWLEQNTDTILSPMQLKGISDVDETLDRFVDEFKKQFLLDFPEQLAISENGSPVDARRLIKNIKAFYKAKGTEKAYQFLFRILYDTAVEFYYPKKDILRLSDGKWIQKSSLRTTSTQGSRLLTATGKSVFQRNSSGAIVASAKVSTVNTFQVGFYEIAEIFLSGINGTFVANKPIELTDGNITTIESSVLPVVSNVTVLNAGSNYKVGDRVLFTASAGDSGKGAYGIVSKVNSEGGVIKIDIQNFGINYRTAPSVSIVSPRGQDFVGVCTSVGVCEYAGYYANNDGRLSTNKVMQDNHYYQNYSYVLLSEITIDKYRDSIRRLIHPAGLGFFGQVAIKRCVRAELDHHVELMRFEIPIIGHYAPYTFLTFDDLSEWFVVSGTKIGYDPNVHDTLIVSADGNPVSDDVSVVNPVDPLDTPDTQGDPFWIIYQHPNRKIKDRTSARIWFDQKSDFLSGEENGLAWHEWTLTGQQNQLDWSTGFTSGFKYATLKYDRESEFRRITARSFFEMPIGLGFDCRSERIEVPATPVVAISVGSRDLSPEAGATAISNGSVLLKLSVNNQTSLNWYSASTIRITVTKTTNRTITTYNTDVNSSSILIENLSDGQYTISAQLYDFYNNPIAGSTSNTLSFEHIHNTGAGTVGA